jgi:tRNA-modifying protein YgfZ
MTDAATAIELDGQYRALREEAGYLRRERGMLLIGGPDGAAYLQGQLTNDIEALDPGRGCYAALLDRKGHIQADMRVLRLEASAPDGSEGGDPGIWLDLEPEPAPAVLKHLTTYSIGREVSVDAVSERWSITSLIGPRATEITGFEELQPEHAQGFRDWEGVQTLAVATDLGLDLITRAERSSDLRGLLAATGAHEVSEDAAEILRIESGRPRFGLDMGPETMPAEAGIVARAVNFEKGCYIGQEPVARLHYRGKPNRRLRGLRLSGAAERGTPLRLGDREVGTIGSACVDPALGPIALSVVRREAADGDRVAVGDGELSAEVVELPFRA